MFKKTPSLLSHVTYYEICFILCSILVCYIDKYMYMCLFFSLMIKTEQSSVTKQPFPVGLWCHLGFPSKMPLLVPIGSGDYCYLYPLRYSQRSSPDESDSSSSNSDISYSDSDSWDSDRSSARSVSKIAALPKLPLPLPPEAFTSETAYERYCEEWEQERRTSGSSQ